MSGINICANRHTTPVWFILKLIIAGILYLFGINICANRHTKPVWFILKLILAGILYLFGIDTYDNTLATL